MKTKYFTTEIKKIVILFSIFYFLFSRAFAAEIFFGAHSPRVVVGQVFEIGVFLNTSGKDANAIGGAVTIPPDYFTIKEIRDGNSIVNLWLQRPLLNANADGVAGQIVFSGVLPGGYIGNQGLLFSVVVEARQVGVATIRAAEEQILENNGEGTALALKKAPLTVHITEQGARASFTPPIDQTPPELFTPQLGQSDALFDGRWFVAFVTQDKNSGIDHYAVREKIHGWWPSNSQWIVAESPYELHDQNLTSDIMVKVVDRAGNERVATLTASRRPWGLYAIWSILISAPLLLFAWLLFLRKK